LLHRLRAAGFLAAAWINAIRPASPQSGGRPLQTPFGSPVRDADPQGRKAAIAANHASVQKTQTAPQKVEDRRQDLMDPVFVAFDISRKPISRAVQFGKESSPLRQRRCTFSATAIIRLQAATRPTF